MRPLRFYHNQRARSEASAGSLLRNQRFRTAWFNGDEIILTRFLIARNSGVIRWNEVKSLPGPAKAYGAGESDDTPAPEAQQQAGLYRMAGQQLPAITSRCCWSNWNNRAIAYPIRVGRGSAAAAAMAGRGSGPLKKNAVAGDGTILACSCVPKKQRRWRNNAAPQTV